MPALQTREGFTAPARVCSGLCNDGDVPGASLHSPPAPEGAPCLALTDPGAPCHRPAAAVPAPQEGDDQPGLSCPAPLPLHTLGGRYERRPLLHLTLPRSAAPLSLGALAAPWAGRRGSGKLPPAALSASRMVFSVGRGSFCLFWTDLVLINTLRMLFSPSALDFARRETSIRVQSSLLWGEPARVRALQRPVDQGGGETHRDPTAHTATPPAAGTGPQGRRHGSFITCTVLSLPALL